jgi:hypothetical protein
MASMQYQNSAKGKGWIWLIAGVIIFLAGVAVFYRSPFAQVIGIATAFFGIVVSLLSLYAYPLSSLIGVLLASLVIYGLAAYGGEEPSI